MPEPVAVPLSVEVPQPIALSLPDEAPQPAAAAFYPPPAADPALPPAVRFPEEEEGWFTKWLRANPDLEKFIGENLINKIGIAVLVLGIAFFVKYAIDREWINEVGRVCIGLLCGTALIGLAHYLRRGYRAFSSVLAGGGLAVFYFTIALAFQQYQLMSQGAAFGVMVVITGFAVALSVLYDKVELAVIAAVGGFLTPFLVSTGEGNYIVLFTYLVILNGGLLALAYFKRWPILNILALFFTELIFTGWMMRTAGRPGRPVSWPLVLTFATVFYLLFLGMALVHQVTRSRPFRTLDFLLLLFITGSWYTIGMAVMEHWNGGRYQGLFTLGMGLVNFGLTAWLMRRRGADRNLLYLLIGLTMSFITLAIPVQLRGHTITLFWSAEAVLLYWLYQRSQMVVFKWGSALVTVLTLLSLLIDWQQAGMNAEYQQPVIYTDVRGFVTNLVVAASFAGLYALLRREPGDRPYLLDLPVSGFRKLFLGMAVFIIYLTGIYGVNLYFGQLRSGVVPNAWHQLITYLFMGAGMWLLQRCTGRRKAWAQQAILLGGFLYWLFSAGRAGGLRNGVLAGIYGAGQLAVHWLSVLLLLGMIGMGIRVIRRRPEWFAASGKALGWAYSAALLLFFSVEVMHLYVAVGYGSRKDPAGLVRQYSKAGLTILWALCSFAAMWLGMRHKYRPLRIISLTLFAVVLGKLFLLDIRGISEGGKIAAFILLGVLLLTVSFMYQKLKKIIIDDRPE